MAVSKVEITTENGTETLMDLTGDTVTPETLAEGETAHGANGSLIVGTAKKVNIVQEVGDSETDVMSQKAVTNALQDSRYRIFITGSEETGYRTDKEYSEIVEAYNKGKEVYCTYLYGEMLVNIPLVMDIAVESMMMFAMSVGDVGIAVMLTPETCNLNTQVIPTFDDIPTDVSQLNNDAKYVQEGHKHSWDDIEGTPEMGGGVTSWNDLQDKPFYSNGFNTVALLEETELLGAEGTFLYPVAIDGVNVGETYTIKYNGVEYVCEGKPIEDGGVVATSFGNGEIMGFELSTEPFFAMVAPKGVVETIGFGMVVMPLDGAETVTFGIYQEQEDIKKLDNKYLDLEWIPTSIEKEEILLDGEQEFKSNTIMYDVNMGAEPIRLVAGDKYIVTWNGVNYECIAIGGTASLDNGTAIYTCIGGFSIDENGGTPNADYSNIPFMLMYVMDANDSNNRGGMLGKESGSRENIPVTIKHIMSQYKPMPKKFLPSGLATEEYVNNALATLVDGEGVSY